ncbi:MAG TPA: DUF3800 domain-containing protein [Candidatus Tectomicrobia bacterium]
MAEAQRHKLYAYVDESGQETRGRIFLVAVVVTGETRDALRNKLKAIEQGSGKQAKKWTKARLAERTAYMQAIIQSSEFVGRISYARYQDTRSYVDLMILATAQALHAQGVARLSATIIVDGLARPERPRFAAGVRKLGIAVRKVRGARDESDELIRLADAVAGFVRDSLEGSSVMQALFDQARRRGVIREV